MHKKTKIIFTTVIAFGMLSLAKDIRAATYYADSSLGASCASGNYSMNNRACNGSDGNAYTTIQAAVDAAITAGDIVDVRAGTYSERVTTKAAGTSESSRIVIRAHSGEEAVVSSATSGGFRINHPYITLDGFKITGRCTDNDAFIKIDTPASYTKVLNNSITPGEDDTMYGIAFANYTTVTSYALVQNNLIDGGGYPAMNIWGNYHQIIGNTITHTYHDAMRVWGHDHLIKNNQFLDMYDDGRTHVDLWQTFGGQYGGDAYDVTIEGNYARNCQAQIGNFKAGSDNEHTLRDWTFINNVFEDVDNPANLYMPGFKFYGNTFYRVAQTLSHPLRFADDGVNGGGHDAEVLGNLFIYCGSNQTTYGWYSTVPEITGFLANYNYVAAGPDQNFSAKTGFNETHGINGGDPRFINIGSSNFHLAADSPAIDMGTTITELTSDKDGVSRPQGSGWDIGAYEYVSGVDATAPIAPSGLSVI